MFVVSFDDFVRRVVFVRAWAVWLQEDPCVWLPLGFVPPSSFLVCVWSFSLGGSGIWVELVAVDCQLRDVWIPCFCGRHPGAASVDAFLSFVGLLL